MSIPSIIKMCRDIHLVNMKPISLISDMDCTPLPITVQISSATDGSLTPNFISGTTIINCAAPHFLNDGDSVTLASMTVSAYNGTYKVKILSPVSFYVVLDFAGTATGQFGSFDGTNFDNLEGRAILAAVTKYNKDIPWRQVAVFQGGPYSNRYYLDTAIPGWDSMNYKIDRIQYPFSSNITPVSSEFYMNSNSWHQTLEGDTNRPILQFISENRSGYGNSNPAQAFGVWYIRPHTFNFAQCLTSIPEIHSEAIAALAASKVLRSACSKAAQFGDRGGPGFESKDLGVLLQRLRDCAKDAEKLWSDLIGEDEPAFGPYFENWTVPSPTGTRDFHPPEFY
jgi:hypothetical protein